MTILRNTKIKNAKKDSNQSSGSTPNRGSTSGSTKLRCPDVSDNYDCVSCTEWDSGVFSGNCNIFQFIPVAVSYRRDWDVWASEVKDFSVSEGQPSVTPTRENIMSKDGGILVQAGRHGTTAVADSFLKLSKNKPFGVLHYDSHGKDVPEKLNFWVTVDLTYTIDFPGGIYTGVIESVTFGQGSGNDWWITSPNCYWNGDCFNWSSNNKLIFTPYSPHWFSPVRNNQVLVDYSGSI